MSGTDELKQRGRHPKNDSACGETSADMQISVSAWDHLAILRTVLICMVAAAAVAALAVHFLFPVMRIYGSSMSPTLVDGDIVICMKTDELERGDIGAFYSGGSILCKRIVGLGGDVISIGGDGTVYVNDVELDEPYLKGKSYGVCSIEFPYTVPEDSYFVLGDNRRESVDSRSASVGCVQKEQMVGRLLFCILPPAGFGTVR